MARIHVLDEHIANQIAAGEVVERPSSVVKELVENSIDAGSTTINVAIGEGGLDYIRITDNGSGIDHGDCEMAFYRHATSKITSGKDLFQIRSLGFRGEALPSIAAVSKVECVSSSTTDGLGRKVIIEGGTLRSVQETAAQRGTDFLVRELFYNTPARLKYMKTIQTELGNVSDYIYRLALAHPHISFTLRHNGNLLLQTLGNGDMLQVIAAIYGVATAKSMLEICGDNLDYSIQGYISKPEMTRASRVGMTTIINGRYIRNFSVVQTIQRAYHTLLPINRFPVVILSIQMDPSLVDVNVHPSKLEVRFSKEIELMQFLEHQLKQRLGLESHMPDISGIASKKAVVVQEQLDFYKQTDSQEETAQQKAASIGGDLSVIREADRSGEAYNKPNNAASSSEWKKPEWKQPDWKQPVPAQALENSLEIYASAFTDVPAVLPSFPKLYPIGQMHGTYIVAQNDTGLYLIDQHAAHERVNYEYYYAQFGNPAKVSQELLIPITLEFTPSDSEAIRNKLALFEQAGVYMEAFGGNTFIIRSIPQWFPSGDEKALIEEMAEWVLAEKKSVDIAKLREKSAIMCSCKASIKANDSLTNVELDALLDRLRACQNPYTCPHGRPIVISFSTYELEKMFKRVM